jgi:hypothetical protein
MRSRSVLLLLALVSPATLFAQSSYYEHVVFDNSLADGSFYYSHASVTVPSKLEASKDKLPIDTTHFVSPPNALRLKWTSETGGDWNIEIQARVRYGMPEMVGNSLWLWVYSESELTANQSPLLYLRDSDGEGTASIRMLGTLDHLPGQKWVHIRLPFDSFKGQVENTREEHFDSRHLAGIDIVQGLDDGKEHTLYIDDIEVRDEAPREAVKPSAPSNLNAKGYDRHVELSWHPVSIPALRYYKIYRAIGGDNYLPMASSAPA